VALPVEKDGGGSDLVLADQHLPDGVGLFKAANKDPGCG
jgi:hypothetical protein